MPESPTIDQSTAPALAGQRVLLVTDRPFVEPVDGSTHTYLMWLQVLTGLGCRVSVLSFDHRSVRWSPEDRARLEALTDRSLILEANGAPGEAAALAWRLLAGRRYLPAVAERALRRGSAARLEPFLREGRFDAIVLNKLHTTALIGRRLFQSVPARKIIDMHDNYPLRETLNRQVLAGLARSDFRLFRATFKPRETLQAAGWAGQGRKMAEEVARLADFDHVVFNAAQEADAYADAGLPRSRIAVLPLPYPEEHAEPPAGPAGPRPYGLGLIASASISNIEGLRFLLREIMPTLRARGVRLLVAGTVGRIAKTLMESGNGPGGDTVLGWIDDVAEFYRQVEVVAVPLLTGTGVSVKTMEAATYGAAIVTTRVGLRGLELEPGTDVLLAEDAGSFADAVLRLLDDPALRAGLRRNAAAALRRRHSREAFTESVARLLRPGPGS